MNFTDFLYDVFILKSYETKSYVERNREGRGERERMSYWIELKSLKENAPQDGILSSSRSQKLQLESTSAKNKWTRQTLSPLNQKYDEICHIIKGTRRPLLQKDDGKTAQSSFNEIQGARAQHLNFIKCILCSFFIEISVYNKPSFLC